MAKIKDLKERILIQQHVKTADGQGGFSEVWNDVITLWAKIEPTSASERYFSQRVESNVTHKITIRWKDDLNTSMRINYQNRLFQIHGIRREDEQRWFMILDCVENVGS